MVKKEYKIYFLEINFYDQLTGIEHSALLRAKLFREKLGQEVIFLVSQYNPRSQLRVVELRESGKLLENPHVIGMYDWLQGTMPFHSDIKTVQEPNGEGLFTKEVAGLKDYRVYDKDSKMFMYRKYDREGDLLYDNIFCGGKKIRRDYYDSNGYLSKIQYLSIADEHLVCEQYYHTSGWVCLYKFFQMEGDQNKLAGIHLMDKGGAIKEVFRTEAEFIAFWLQEMTCNDESSVFFVDKARAYCQAQELIEPGKIKMVNLIHSSHVSNNENYMESRINSNYQWVFENLNKPEAIVVLTERQREHVEARFSKQGNLHVIPHANAVEIEQVPFEGRIPGRAVVVGRYAVEKQLEKLIDIYRLVLMECPNATLQLYGAGPLRDSLRKKVKELNLENSIFVNDYVENVTDVYDHAQIAISTSRFEGFSLFVLESISHGCATIGFDANYGPASMIDDGVNGYLIPLDDDERMKDMLIKLLNDKELLEEMSKKSYEKAKSFTGESIAALWRDLLDGIMKD